MIAQPLDLVDVHPATPPSLYGPAYEADAPILRALLAAVLDADAPLAEMRARLVDEANTVPLALLFPNGDRVLVTDYRQVPVLVAAIGLPAHAFAAQAPALAAGLVAVNQRDMLLQEAVIQYSRSPNYRRSAPVDAQMRGLQRWLNVPGAAGSLPTVRHRGDAGHAHAVDGAE